MRIEEGEIETDCAPDRVAYAVVLPEAYDEGEVLPLCLFLHGGTGSHHDLIGLSSLFEAWFSSGLLPQMVVACASTGPLDYYLDFPDGSKRWETFIITDFLAHLRERFSVEILPSATLIVNVSHAPLSAAGVLPFSRRNTTQAPRAARLLPSRNG